MRVALVTLQAAALPRGALQHVDNLVAVDVAQGCVQVLHCQRRRESKALASRTEGVEPGTKEDHGRDVVQIRIRGERLMGIRLSVTCPCQWLGAGSSWCKFSSLSGMRGKRGGKGTHLNGIPAAAGE